MMNGGHASFSALTGTMLVSALDAFQLAPVTPQTYLWCAVLLSAGAGLINDIDSDGAAFSTSVPMVTRPLGELLQWCSRTSYRVSARECDRSPYANRRDYDGLTPFWKALVTLGIVTVADEGDTDKVGEHRGLTHWWGFAVIVGVLLAWLIAAYPIAALFVTGICLPSGIRALTWDVVDLAKTVGITRLRGIDRWTAMALSVVITLIFAEDIIAFGPWIGVVVALGMLNHDCGDSITKYGIPWKAFIPHRCDRHRAQHPQPARKCAMWDRNTILPAWMTFTTGSPVELVISAASLAGTGGLVSVALL